MSEPAVSYGANPVPDVMPEIRGLFVGGCVDHGIGRGLRRYRAHAHRYHPWLGLSPNAGWVCVASPRRVYVEGTDRPTRTMWHEYAHILTPGHRHDEVWQAKMLELGQRVPKRYRKKRYRKKLAAA